MAPDMVMLRSVITSYSIHYTKLYDETVKYLKSVADAEIDFKPRFNKKTVFLKEGNSEVSNKELYADLNAWRKSVAEDSNAPVSYNFV